MSQPPEVASVDAPSPRAVGVVGLLALVAGLVGVALWTSMLMGTWKVATGLLDARDHLERAEDLVAKSDVKKGRVEALSAAASVDRARDGLLSGAPILDALRLIGPIDSALPELGHILSAADHSAAAAEETLNVTRQVLNGRNKLIGRVKDDPEQSQIRLPKVAELAASIERVHREISGSRTELQEVDLQNLPKRLRPDVTDAIEKAEEAEVTLTDVETGLELLPAFLGAEGPRTYLFGMQNNAEQRGSGGALLQFTTLTIDQGLPTLQASEEEGDSKASGSVYNIDKNRTPLDIPLPDDAWYQAVSDARRFGNANWSPDWPLAAQLTVAYGEESARRFDVDFPKIDGVIAVDPIVMEELVAGTGPFKVEGAGARVTQRRIVDFLLYRAYARYPRQHNRRPVLKKLVDSFYDKIIQPKKPSKLFEGMATSLGQKHMQIWMRDPAEQRFVRHMNWDGGIEKAKGADYLYLVEQNVGGNKLDYHSTQTTTSTITIEGNEARHRTTALVENNVFLPQPAFAMGDTGDLGQGNVHRPMLNLYVPSAGELTGPPKVVGTRRDSPPELATWTDGNPAVHSERGKKVWSGTLEIPPLGKGSLSFDYRVPNVVRDVGGRRVYRLHVQHQPKVHPETLSLILELPDGATHVKARGWRKKNGQLTWNRPLEEDLVLEVSWRE